MSSPIRLTIPGMLQGGFTFWRARWLACLAAGIPYVLAAGALAAAGGAGAYWAAFAGVAAASILLLAAVFRMAMRGAPEGFLGLQLGADEVRMGGAWLLVSLLMLLVGSVTALVVTAMVSGVLFAVFARGGVDPDSLRDSPDALYTAFGAGEWAVTGMIGLIAVLFLLWFAARLSLAWAATIAERRIVALESFTLTRGNGWRIAAVLAAISLPLMAVQFAVLSALGGAEAGWPAAFGAGLIAGAVSAAAIFPLTAGATAHAYRALRPQGDGAGPVPG